VHYLRRDIADSGDRRGLIDDVKQCCGALHVLVNNAGVAPRERRDIIDATEESFDFVLGVNLRGPYFLPQAAARWMLEQAGGDESYRKCIITVSSVSATMASVHRGEYCIAKAGLAMAVKLWAARLAPHGLPVYEIRPGIIETDMTAGVREKYDRLIADGLVPQRRWGTPADVGKAAAALARGDLPFSTGQVVMVDGGLALSRL
jgi:NAD(P)-dependent dehydrogenase (short-subunit alcohol dehydrogenase family)